jgi:hypothetical protein
VFDDIFAAVSHEYHIQNYAYKLIIFGIIILFAICRIEEYQETEIKLNSFQLFGFILHDDSFNDTILTTGAIQRQMKQYKKFWEELIAPFPLSAI